MRGANLWRRNQGESIQDILTIYNPFGLTTLKSGDFSKVAVVWRDDLSRMISHFGFSQKIPPLPD
jgi:hypothetical protein